ncbi:MAG: hypothetical protein LBU09_02710, partial [Endomicrobium sp.]|nr:hypothetical protein [Endomicrobium sp.]
MLFCLAYPEFFKTLSFLEKAKSFAFGLRFDINAISVFFGYFIILMFLPISKKQSAIIKICVVLMTISALSMLLLLFGDFFYFAQVRRHMTEELVLAWMERGLIARYIFQNYWHLLLAIFAALFFIMKIIFNFIDRSFAADFVKHSLAKSLSVFLCAAFLLFLGVRASFSDRPINMTNVFSMAD